MTEHEMKRLKVGDHVSYDDPGTEHHCPDGIVIETGYCSVKIEWCDGQVGTLHVADGEWVRAALARAQEGGGE